MMCPRFFTLTPSLSLHPSSLLRSLLSRLRLTSPTPIPPSAPRRLARHATHATLSEEFFRLKKVQGKKKRNAERAETERRAAAMRGEAVDEGSGEAEGKKKGAGGDMLGGGKDEDVIF
jgi:hypothetical protein